MTAVSIIGIIISGIVAIIFVGGLVNWGNMYFESRLKRTKDAATSDEMLERLAQIERRLTDTQDVMLALSDKMDQWDSHRSTTSSVAVTPRT